MLAVLLENGISRGISDSAIFGKLHSVVDSPSRVSLRMGSGASTMPGMLPTMTKDQAKEYAGNKYDEAVFDSLAVDGVVSCAKVKGYMAKIGVSIDAGIMKQNRKSLYILKMVVPFCQDIKSLARAQPRVLL